MSDELINPGLNPEEEEEKKSWWEIVSDNVVVDGAQTLLGGRGHVTINDAKAMQELNPGMPLQNAAFLADRKKFQEAGGYNPIERAKNFGSWAQQEAKDWAQITANQSKIDRDKSLFRRGLEKTFTRLPSGAEAGKLIHYASNLFPENIGNVIELGTGGLISDAYKNFADAVSKKDLADTDWGTAIDRFEEDIYTSMGHKPRSQMTYEEREGDNARAQMMLGFYLVPLLNQLGIQITGSALAAKYPLIGKLAAATNPLNLTSKGSNAFLTFIKRGGEFATKTAALNAAESPFHTAFADNTYGSWLSAISPEDDPALTAEGNADAVLKSIIPNLVGDSMVALALNIPGKIAGKTIKSGSSLLSQVFENVNKAKVTNSIKRKRKAILEKQLQEGIFSVDDDGKAALGSNYSDVDIKTDAPETIEIEEAIDNFASYEDKIKIRDSEESVPVAIETLLNNADELPDQPYRWQDVSAPIESYPQTDISWSDQLGKIPTKNLISLANPEINPDFADRLLDISGKDFSQATRTDVIETIKSFEAEGKVLMPNRLMGGKILRGNQINVNPKVFQFKKNVNETTGQVLGNDSLAGVERFNPNLEGTLKVWEDNEGTYNLVDGHNRFALGQKLGVPSYRVEVLDAMDAGGARAQGALANIAGGKGTGVDAANFFKDAGIVSPDELTGLGVPLSSGTASKGLALSKLPDNIFRDVAEGKITELKGAAIGGSGLDKNAMQQAYKILKDTELTESQLREVLLQAKNAPTVDGQVDLFGNTEQLNLMIEKAKLASAINRTISKDKNLFSRVGSNVERLKTAGTDVDVSEAANQRAIAEQLSTQFNADKYTESEVSKILNEGAIMLSEGGKTGPVSRKIYPRIVKAITENPAIPVKPSEVKEPLARQIKLPTDDELTNEILAKAIKNGDARPPSTPDIQTPDEVPLSYSKVVNDLKEGKLSDEIGSLVEAEQNAARQFGKIDDAIEADRIATKRDAAGYDSMTFEEKKNNGLLTTKKEPFNMQSLEDARKSETIQPKAKEVTPEKKRPWKVFSLPHGYKRMKPRYGQLVPEFESDLDMVAYIIRDGKKASAREPEILQILKDFELTKAEVKAHGRKVHQKLKDMVKEKTGSASASADNTAGLELTVPNMDFRGRSDGRVRGAFDPREYGFLDNDFTGGKYNEAATRANMIKEQALREVNESKRLQDWGRRIADTSKGILRQSRRDAVDMAEAMKEASKIAGIPVENIKILDQIDAIELFGVDSTAGAVAKWSPQKATFMIRNPQDPLTRTAGGEFLGLNLRSETENLMDGSIYLSLYPAIQNRYKGLASNVLKTGRPFRQVFYHEAFHTVQDWLDLRGNEKLKGALKTQAAQKEMKDIIADNRGTFFKRMTDKEIEAEAFGWWKNNKTIKLKDKGLKGAFERIKTYLNVFSAKLKQKLNINPSYIDVFELAASGDIARKTMVKNLTPKQIASYVNRIDADTHRYIPELTERINEFLFFKKIELDEAMNRWSIDANSGGCL